MNATRRFLAPVLALLVVLLSLAGRPARAQAPDTTPPAQTVKLIFVHHSSGENWLADDNGGLGLALRNNHYFVSDTNYGWDGGGTGIGDRTDIGNWYEWFAGPDHLAICAALFAESEPHSGYSRLDADPGGENQIVMFKSCFPNSQLGGHPNDPPTTGDNPLRGQDAYSDAMTVANAKGIYVDLLPYFASRQDKLFVVITAPPLASGDTDAAHAANARALDTWLVKDWLVNYPYQNVAVFDFYNVLTSNGGNANKNDLNATTGNHHRVRNGAIEYITNQGGNTSAYPTGDSHPSAAGNKKAAAEFVPLLNYYYHRWQASQANGTATPTPTTKAATATPSATPPAATPTKTNTPATPVATPTRTATLSLVASSTPTPAGTPAACTHVVAPTGSDDNPGSASQPWRTLQYAVDHAAPGDTICVRGGTYNEHLSITASGEPGRPITLRGYPGEKVVLDGQGLEWRYGIDVGGANYWTFENLIVLDYIREGERGFGFVSWGGSRGITLRHMEFAQVGTAIKFHQGGQDITIEDVYAHEYDGTAFDCGPDGPCNRVTLRRVIAEGPGTEGGWGADGLAVESGADILVEDCSASAHGSDGFDFKSDRTTLRRVTAHDNGHNNIKLWGTDSLLSDSLSYDAGLTNLVLAEGGSYTVQSSTIANSKTYGYLAEMGGYDKNISTTVRLYGNIFYNDNPQMGGTTLYLAQGVHLSADRNLYYNPYRSTDVICAFFVGAQGCFGAEQINNGAWATASGQEQHSRYVDPLFVNAGGQDFTLSADSPAIDQGDCAHAGGADLLGNVRPQGAGCDIGALEYATGPAATLTPRPTVVVTLAPTSTPTRIYLPSVRGRASQILSDIWNWLRRVLGLAH